MENDRFTTPPQQLHNILSYGDEVQCVGLTREVIHVHHMYNNGTTPLSYGVGPIVCGAHPM
jgi:hypothetical protein